MAQYRLNPESTDATLRNHIQKWYSTVPDLFCAEHGGTIPSFRNSSKSIERVVDFRNLVRRDRWNVYRAASVAGAGVSFATLAAAAAVTGGFAPAVATWLGSTGLLGAAGTGTAIATLNGAALTSASVAAIGTGGAMTIVAATAGVGGGVGATLLNRYLGDVRDFDFKRIAYGRDDYEVIFINGFLQQNVVDFHDWAESVGQCLGGANWYGLTWESKTLLKLGGNLGEAGFKRAASAALEQGIKKGSKRLAKAVTGPLAGALALADMAGNPWHVALSKAQQTAAMLAMIIARTPRQRKYVLCGHSLGARVVAYTLAALHAAGENDRIADAILVSGAVGLQNQQFWSAAEAAVSGKIYNVHSTKDLVLRLAYPVGTTFTSTPIGSTSIRPESQKFVNIDMSSDNVGHMDAKIALGAALTKVNYVAPWARSE